jgi:transcriptional antiterminator
VKHILERIPDPRKRLAFYLYMNDVPYHSKKKNVHTIAQALNVSDRTARDWVEEVRESLENDQDIQYLKNGK